MKLAYSDTRNAEPGTDFHRFFGLQIVISDLAEKNGFIKMDAGSLYLSAFPE